MSFIPRSVVSGQRGNLTLPGDSVTTIITSGNITVLNSAYVRLKCIGQSLQNSAGLLGNAYGWLTLNIVDGTHVTVSFNRNAGSDWACNAEYEVIDLQPQFIKSIQRVPVSFVATTPVITAVVIAKCELDLLGSSDVNSSIQDGYLTLPDTTHVHLNLNYLHCVGYAQVIEYK